MSISKNATPGYIAYNALMVGSGHPTLSDTLNVAAQDMYADLLNIGDMGAIDTVIATWKDNATITLTAGGICFADDGSYFYQIDSNTDVAMPTDLDTGAEAANTLYYVWLGLASGTPAAKLSVSATTPTGLTATHRLRFAVRNNNSSNFMGFKMDQRAYLYDEDIVAGGSDVTEVKDASVSTFEDCDCSGFVPSGKRLVYVLIDTATGGVTTRLRPNGSSASIGLAALICTDPTPTWFQVDASGIFEIGTSAGGGDTTRVSVIGYDLIRKE